MWGLTGLFAAGVAKLSRKFFLCIWLAVGYVALILYRPAVGALFQATLDRALQAQELSIAATIQQACCRLPAILTLGSR
jgi:hypothetical protein